jgi:Ca2+:H+ antiporter
MRAFSRSDLVLIVLAAVLTAGSALAAHRAGTVVPFVLAAMAVAVLAALVGRAVDHLADRLGAGAVGVLQSALGNLPELFIALFALRSGLTTVVTSAVIGSILANLLLVLGLSFAAGGARHGILTFSATRARMIMGLMLLAVAGMLVPSLASFVHSPAGGHEVGLSRVTAIVLLLVFALSVPASVRREGAAVATSGRLPEVPVSARSGQTLPREPGNIPREGSAPARAGGAPGLARPDAWPMWLAIGMLAVTGVLAAYVSDLFVEALQPAITTLHISQAFAGLVIVAIAGNAVENAVGVKLAWQNQPDHALSVVLNSPLQIALVLAPALVLLAPLVGHTPFTMVFSPLLVTTVATATVAVSFLIYDGMSDWLEGVAMIGLYTLIAASFWWG